MSERLIKQIQFPKIVLPIASAMSGLPNFAFGLVPLVAMMLIAYPDRISPWLLTIPIIAFVQLLFTLPVVVLLSSSNVFYRDVGNLSRHALSLWWFLSPGLYGIALIVQVTKEYPIVGTLMLRTCSRPCSLPIEARSRRDEPGRAPLGLLGHPPRSSSLSSLTWHLQARRASLRQGALMAIGHIDEEHRGVPWPSTPATSACATACASRARRACATTFVNLFRPRSGETSFWALREVSFRVVQGESLAISGRMAPARARSSRSWRASSCPRPGWSRSPEHVSAC